MTTIIRSEGIVLKRRDFGETSRIIVAFTEDAGKVQLLAKGARNAKSKVSAALEPLTRGEFVFYWREAKDLFTLAEATVVRALPRVREDAATLAYGLAVAEAVDRLSAEGDADPKTFALLANALVALDEGAPAKLVLTQFLFAFAAQLGFRPDVMRCNACGRDAGKEGLYYLPRAGTLACARCAPASGAVAVPAAACNVARILLTPAPTAVARVRADDKTLDQALSLIRAHLYFHAGLELRSLAFTGN